MCLGVTCTAGAFAACRGDVALTCNQMGNNYDELQCPMGCTPEAMGCKLCQAGQTVCTNGEVQTCDANGAVTSSQSCPLGCFESQPRCRDVDPSNGLAQYEDMVASPPDVAITNGEFDTGNGTVTDNGGAMTLTVPSFEVPAAPGGVPIRVFVVNNLTIQDATAIDHEAVPKSGTGHALAIVARGDITINGTLKVAPGTGGYVATGCDGADGTYTDRGNDSTAASGGGGAYATDGARGGNVNVSMGGTLEHGGSGGAAAGTAALIPLRGGCAGGAVVDTATNQNPYHEHGGNGGGAVQLTSATKILVSGTIDATGQIGGGEFFMGTGGLIGIIYGGGAGGGILLEGPTVTLGSAAKLLTTGGDGGAACTTTTTQCGLGGHGATSGLGATPGADILDYGGTPDYAETAGGGGGGLGRIRVNTPDQTYTKANTSVEDGASSVGTLSTR